MTLRKGGFIAILVASTWVIYSQFNADTLVNSGVDLS